MELKIPERNVYQFLDYIEKYLPALSVLVELGARDCTETIVMSRYLPGTKIYSFECNPATLPICRKVCKQLPNVELVEKAATNKDGDVSFFAIDPKKTETSWKDGNPGASSLLQASGKYPVEKYVQKKIKVAATRLDTFAEEKGITIDALWMDIQGSELMALEGLGKKLNDVKLIHTEVEFFEIYKSQPLFEEIFKYLTSQGFLLVGFTNSGEFAADAVFINQTILNKAARIRSRVRQASLYKSEEKKSRPKA